MCASCVVPNLCASLPLAHSIVGKLIHIIAIHRIFAIHGISAISITSWPWSYLIRPAVVVSLFVDYYVLLLLYYEYCFAIQVVDLLAG